MTKPLSNDFRMRLIESVGQGLSCHQAAERFGVAVSTVVKLMQRWRQTGTSAPRPQGGDRRSERIEVYADEVLDLIAACADITLAEMAAHLEQKHGERFAQSTIWRLLDRHRMTFKKNRARGRAGASRRCGAKAGLARRAA
jgi:transposase